ncbi:MAG: hypothetical protein M1G31_08060 [Pseudanabaena sp. Salubria-1]|nr:hypothetical protein [Pseudanabaena sp. Salubria-1]
MILEAEFFDVNDAGLITLSLLLCALFGANFDCADSSLLGTSATNVQNAPADTSNNLFIIELTFCILYIPHPQANFAVLAEIVQS